MTQQPHLSQGLELSDAAFNALWEKFRDRFPVDSRPEVGRAFAEAVADVLTPTAAPLLNREPVFFRYRHSEQEKWHYGPVALNWWECQPLFAPSEMSENAEEKNALFADGQNSTSLASSTRPHDRGPICFLPRKDLLCGEGAIVPVSISAFQG